MWLGLLALHVFVFLPIPFLRFIAIGDIHDTAQARHLLFPAAPAIAIFLVAGVDAVFTGHYHRYFSAQLDGIRYTNVGSSGGYSQPGPTGLHYHFVWVTVDGDDWSIAPIRLGSVLPWDEMTVEGSKNIRTMAFSGIEFPTPAPLSSQLSVESNEVMLLINNLLINL